MMKRLAVLAATAAFLALSAAAAGAASLVLPRAGQVGIGLNGSYALLANGGSLGGEFGQGPGLGVRLRYRMRYERAIGLSFDMLTLDAREAGFPEGAFSGYRDVGDSLLTRDHLSMSLTGFELFQMFDTRSRDVKWLSVGAGLVQISARLSNGETQYPLGGDGTFVGVGAGIERFVYRSWAVDCSARYQAVFYDSSVNHNVQATLGMIFYAAY